MFGNNPVIELTYKPVPVPSIVLLLVIVGLFVVAQQTPLEVTEALPSEVTLPPDVAVFCVIAVNIVVVTVGITEVTNVVNCTSAP